MSNLIAAILSIIVLVSGGVPGTTGGHVGFPYVADYNGAPVYTYREASDHNSADGSLVIIDEAGAEVYRFGRADYGNLDLRGGAMFCPGGTCYMSMVLLDWTKPSAVFAAQARARVYRSTDGMQTWQSLGLTNYGVSQFAHGHPFIQGGSLFVSTYSIDSSNRWLSLLWRYDLAAGTWHIRSKFVETGLRYMELAVVPLADNEWLAITRTKVDEIPYNGEWLTFWRSANQGGKWTKELQTLPINAAGIAYHEGIVYIAGRGCGGSCLYSSSDGGRTFTRETLDVFYYNCNGDGGMADVNVAGGQVIAAWYGIAPECTMFIKRAEVE